MDGNQMIEKYYEEIGERCPSLLAIHLEIEVDSISDFEDCVSGMYVPTINAIILNSTLSLEKQEKALSMLLIHHLTHEGVWYVLKTETLEKELRKYQSKTLFQIKSLLRSLEGTLHVQ